MKKSQAIMMTAMVFVVLLSGLSFGEEKVKAEKESGGIKFVKPKEPKKFIPRTHSARFVVNGDSYVNLKDLLSTEAYKGLSDLQKKFLDEQLYTEKQKGMEDRRRATRSQYDHSAFSYYDTKNGMRSWNLYAVSEEDAKKMVEVAVEYFEISLDGRIQHYRERVAEWSDEMDGVKAKIGELEKELKPVLEQRAAYEKGLNPSLLKGDEAIIKIHDQLDEYKIKLRGIEARQQAIDRTQHILNERLKAMDPSRISAERQAINALRIKYDEMQADLEIERAGIRAEKEMLEERLDTVQAYWELTERNGKLSSELKSKKASLSKLRKSHENGVQYLEKLESRPIEIVDNEVVVSELK